jgi:hypothetical protein
MSTPILERESSVVEPRRLSGPQLARLGVEILNKYDLFLKCMSCGEVWTPQLEADGSLKRGGWRCPNRCNW